MICRYSCNTHRICIPKNSHKNVAWTFCARLRRSEFVCLYVHHNFMQLSCGIKSILTYLLRWQLEAEHRGWNVGETVTDLLIFSCDLHQNASGSRAPPGPSAWGAMAFPRPLAVKWWRRDGKEKVGNRKGGAEFGLGGWEKVWKGRKRVTRDWGWEEEGNREGMRTWDGRV